MTFKWEMGNGKYSIENGPAGSCDSGWLNVGKSSLLNALAGKMISIVESTAGVNLASIKRMYLGVGDRVNPKAGGMGSLYFDDIRLYRPKRLPSETLPDADLSGNCVVDYPDLEIIAGQWLQVIPPATALS